MIDKKLLLDKTKMTDIIKRYAFMVVGCFSYSLSLRLFLIPNGIVGGGVSGAASLIELLSGVDASIFIALINIPILIMGLKLMGWLFIWRCLVTTATLSLCTYLQNFIVPDNFTNDGVLASLYGGVLQGIGIGLFIRYEMSSGGTELLGRLTYHVVPFGSIAIHTAVFDGAVVILGAILLHNLENVLYALILIFVSAKVSDMIVMGLSSGKLCYIITDKSEEISEYLLSHSPRGITLINGTGMYSKLPKGVLMTCIKDNQIVALKRTVKVLDENAFVIVCSAKEVYGKGFNRIDG